MSINMSDFYKVSKEDMISYMVEGIENTNTKLEKGMCLRYTESADLYDFANKVYKVISENLDQLSVCGDEKDLEREIGIIVIRNTVKSKFIADLAIAEMKEKDGAMKMFYGSLAQLASKHRGLGNTGLSLSGSGFRLM